MRWFMLRPFSLIMIIRLSPHSDHEWLSIQVIISFLLFWLPPPTQNLTFSVLQEISKSYFLLLEIVHAGCPKCSNLWVIVSYIISLNQWISHNLSSGVPVNVVNVCLYWIISLNMDRKYVVDRQLLPSIVETGIYCKYRLWQVATWINHELVL